VAAVLDSTQAGRTAYDVLGFGAAIPIVATLDEGLALAPTALLIGIAPQGGQLPDQWRTVLRQAIEHGLHVWSGLHVFIGDDPELAPMARERGVAIHDLRKPPPGLHVARGRVRDAAATIVLTVGSDSNIGKMTGLLQLRDALRARGHRVAFAATGQTGILLEGAGIAVDAVVADFIAGAAESLVLRAAEAADIVLVEGQGSLIHPGYSGVTLGLMHGTLPHAMIFCHQPSRSTINNNPWVRIPPLPELIRLHEMVVAPLRPAPVIGVSLHTGDLTEEAARRAVARIGKETQLPATDAVRFDPAPLVNAIEQFHAARLDADRTADGGMRGLVGRAKG
jgi:uncharacterized NAD-dependent epimerase/dehydratase family protein